MNYALFDRVYDNLVQNGTINQAMEQIITEQLDPPSITRPYTLVEEISSPVNTSSSALLLYMREEEVVNGERYIRPSQRTPKYYIRSNGDVLGYPRGKSPFSTPVIYAGGTVVQDILVDWNSVPAKSWDSQAQPTPWSEGNYPPKITIRASSAAAEEGLELIQQSLDRHRAYMLQELEVRLGELEGTWDVDAPQVTPEPEPFDPRARNKQIIKERQREQRRKRNRMK